MSPSAEDIPNWFIQMSLWHWVFFMSKEIFWISIYLEYTWHLNSPFNQVRNKRQLCNGDLIYTCTISHMLLSERNIFLIHEDRWKTILVQCSCHARVKYMDWNWLATGAPVIYTVYWLVSIHVSLYQDYRSSAHEMSWRVSFTSGV